jgi:hypothetical protein
MFQISTQKSERTKKIEYNDCIERCSNSIKRVTGEMSVYMTKNL